MNILGIAGWKNSGKTTLATSLVAELTNRGYQVSTIKHAHHNFEIDQPGTDSYRHRKAGANEVLVVSSKRWALIREREEKQKPDLINLIKKLTHVDLVIVEGFKTSSIPKLEVRRDDSVGAAIAPNDPHVLAIASDKPVQDSNLPLFDIDDIVGIADFMIKSFKLTIKKT